MGVLFCGFVFIRRILFFEAFCVVLECAFCWLRFVWGFGYFIDYIVVVLRLCFVVLGRLRF